LISFCQKTEPNRGFGLRRSLARCCRDIGRDFEKHSAHHLIAREPKVFCLLWMLAIYLYNSILIIKGSLTSGPTPRRTRHERGNPDVHEGNDLQGPLTQQEHGWNQAHDGSVAPQVWFELSRYGWMLPSVTLLVTAIGACALRWGGSSQIGDLLLPLLPLVAVLIGAAAHGVYTGVSSIRRPAEPLSSNHFQPVTPRQYASVRILVNAILLVPMLIVAVVLHFALGGREYLAVIVPLALKEGFASYREVVWTLISRGLLVGLFAWAFMTIGTRLMRRVLAATVLVSVIGGAIAYFAGQRPAFAVIVDRIGQLSSIYFHETQHVMGPRRYAMVLDGYSLVFVLMGMAVGSYLYAWAKGIASRRALAAWTGVWVLSAFVLHHVILPAQSLEGSSAYVWVVGILSAIGWAALIPIPWAAVLLDAHRLLGTPSLAHDTPQHESAKPIGARRGSRLLWAGAACFVLFLVWFAWPAKPSYVAVWRNKGYPVTLKELNAWYPEVSDRQNMAPKYLAAYGYWFQLLEGFYSGAGRRYQMSPGDPKVLMSDVMLVGGAKVKDTELIPANVWDATESYWREVTSPLALDLVEIARQDGPSRYPVDLQQGFLCDVGHLRKLRALARELALDAIYAAVAGDLGRAADSITAIVPLADSLSAEPVLLSQLVRIACLTIAQQACETVVNRSIVGEQDLARLQQRFSEALPCPDDCTILESAVVGDQNMVLAAYESDFEDFTRSAIPYALLWRMAFIPQAEYLVFPASGEAAKASARCLWFECDCRQKLRKSGALSFVAPMAGILTPVWNRISTAEWRLRMQLAVTETGLAVERYRLVHGELPAILEDLAPAFLASVPNDYFAGPRRPLKYVRRQDGGYVVYSVSRNGKDDNGVERDDWRKSSDIAFAVAPLSFRADKQVGPETTSTGAGS
jgi:hypothetical protein